MLHNCYHPLASLYPLRCCVHFSLAHVCVGSVCSSIYLNFEGGHKSVVWMLGSVGSCNMQSRSLHRRKSSAGDSDESVVVVTPPADSSSIPLPSSTSPTRTRHQRNASISGLPLNISGPPSAGPYRSAYPASPFLTSFGTSHARTRSISSPYSPSLPSPLSTSTSFAEQMHEREPPPQSIPTSHSAPSQVSSLPPPTSPLAPDLDASRRRDHRRIHSRNLSVFFPRPGAGPQPTTIDEDGAQEIEVPPTLGAGFTFGKTPPGIQPPPKPPSSGAGNGQATRRGHHHKHSVSHSFFSFLEPQSGAEPDTLVTQPTPTPMSPWMPVSPFPASAPVSKTEFRRDEGTHAAPGAAPGRYVAAATAQFLLGATLWVQGQQRGSLSATALGYWAVFDAFGIAIPHISFKGVSKPYATARTQPVLLFAQSVYLMFSAVYVCKEALEHLLLSANVGDGTTGDGHHHHTGDEEDGIEFPGVTLFFALVALVASALMANNHARLVALADNRIPPLRALFSKNSSTTCTPEPTNPVVRMLTNPYSLIPIFLTLGILIVALFLPPAQHRPFDLGLAGAASFGTFSAAYRACVVLGSVLLQTAPRRGLPGGRMEAFLRAMRDVERHSNVLHLPAPHIWQLAASANEHEPQTDGLVVTMEVHVAATLPDDDVLALTRWVRERVVAALGMGGGREKDGTRSRGYGRSCAGINVSTRTCTFICGLDHHSFT
ncbi:hypothetical protein MKEN_01347600 [Mycena kentingensis (nom. inval.)]|nr:hypothetical protein MKEN_01347600 [Mycena kentingensis (nom. inval.)]